jgi:Ser/Thr protein kinase RdoA (MazF antagonist)
MHWEDTHVARIAEAVTHFHSQTSAFEVDPSLVAREDWAQTLDRAINATEANPLEHKAQWKRMHKRLGRALDGLVEQWRARPLEHWVHGDLHLANALCRCDAPDDPVILIDLAEVRPGHWVEDAVYLERQLWSRSHRLAMAPVKTMRAARRTRGLAISDADHVLADIRRLLMASTAPAFLRTEGQPKHLEACLEQATEAATRLQVP